MKSKVLFAWNVQLQYTEDFFVRMASIHDVRVGYTRVDPAIKYSSNSARLNRIDFDWRFIVSEIIRPQSQFYVFSRWKGLKILILALSMRVRRRHTIICFDNTLPSSMIKRSLMKTYSVLFLRIFQAAFVPGESQEQYARFLGFNRISKGLYSAPDVFFEQSDMNVSETRDITFLYVGRLLERKGILDLLAAFRCLHESKKSKCGLVCVGDGDERALVEAEEYLDYRGFLSSSEIQRLCLRTKWVIVPSRWEPWGIIVQEALLCGCGVISSNSVMSARFFGEGFENVVKIFPAGDVASLALLLKSTEGYAPDPGYCVTAGEKRTPYEQTQQLTDLFKEICLS